jgi:hypothetical protein
MRCDVPGARELQQGSFIATLKRLRPLAWLWKKGPQASPGLYGGDPSFLVRGDNGQGTRYGACRDCCSTKLYRLSAAQGLQSPLRQRLVRILR